MNRSRIPQSPGKPGLGLEAGFLSTRMALTSYSKGQDQRTVLGEKPHSALPRLPAGAQPAHRVGRCLGFPVGRSYVTPGLEGRSVISMFPPASGNRRIVRQAWEIRQ